MPFPSMQFDHSFAFFFTFLAILGLLTIYGPLNDSDYQFILYHFQDKMFTLQISYPGHSENLLDKSPMPKHPVSQKKKKKSEDLVEFFSTINSFSSERYNFL